MASTTLSLLVTSLLLTASAKPSYDHQLRHHRRPHAGRERGWRAQADAAAAALHPSLKDKGYFPADNSTLQGYLDTNCSSCLAREEAKWARIERIKRDLLEKLGFSRTPRANATQLPDIHGGRIFDVIREYGLQSDSPDSPYPTNLHAPAADIQAKTERVYAFAKPVSSSRGWSGSLGRANFTFSSGTRETVVTDSKLHVFIRPPSTPTDAHEIEVKVQLFRVTKKGNAEVEYFAAKTERVNARVGKWVEVGMTLQTQTWFAKPDSNFGIHVSADFEGENLAVYPNDNEPNKNMYLEMVTVEGDKASRRKRNAPPKICQEGDEEKRCCRYPLVIDFEAMGWDWVIAPKKYMAYYCNGGCPFKHLQSHVHTHVVQQYGLPDGATGPCCYPTELAPIMMVYLNDDMEVLVANVPSMVANRCGCA